MRTIRDAWITTAALAALAGGCQRPLPGPAATAGAGAAAGAAVGSAVAGCSPAGPLAAPGDLPANLRPPGDSHLVMRLRAEGKQIYRCQKGPSGAWAFTLKAPDARLISDGCTEVGHHFAGPRWSLAADGSVVVGKKLAEAPRPGTIPWLLIAGTPEGPDGAMAGVRFIQRIDTAGGVAPVEGCDEASVDREVAIPYSATYLLYGTPGGATGDQHRPATPRAAAVSNSRS